MEFFNTGALADVDWVTELVEDDKSSVSNVNLSYSSGILASLEDEEKHANNVDPNKPQSIQKRTDQTSSSVILASSLEAKEGKHSNNVDPSKSLSEEKGIDQTSSSTENGVQSQIKQQIDVSNFTNSETPGFSPFLDLDDNDDAKQSDNNVDVLDLLLRNDVHKSDALNFMNKKLQKVLPSNKIKQMNYVALYELDLKLFKSNVQRHTSLGRVLDENNLDKYFGFAMIFPNNDAYTLSIGKVGNDNGKVLLLQMSHDNNTKGLTNLKRIPEIEDEDLEKALRTDMRNFEEEFKKFNELAKSFAKIRLGGLGRVVGRFSDLDENNYNDALVEMQRNISSALKTQGVMLNTKWLNYSTVFLKRYFEYQKISGEEKKGRNLVPAVLDLLSNNDDKAAYGLEKKRIDVYIFKNFYRALVEKHLKQGIRSFKFKDDDESLEIEREKYCKPLIQTHVDEVYSSKIERPFSVPENKVKPLAFIQTLFDGTQRFLDTFPRVFKNDPRVFKNDPRGDWNSYRTHKINLRPNQDHIHFVQIDDNFSMSLHVYYILHVVGKGFEKELKKNTKTIIDKLQSFDEKIQQHYVNKPNLEKFLSGDSDIDFKTFDAKPILFKIYKEVLKWLLQGSFHYGDSGGSLLGKTSFTNIRQLLNSIAGMSSTTDTKIQEMLSRYAVPVIGYTMKSNMSSLPIRQKQHQVIDEFSSFDMPAQYKFSVRIKKPNFGSNLSDKKNLPKKPQSAFASSRIRSVLKPNEDASTTSPGVYTGIDASDIIAKQQQQNETLNKSGRIRMSRRAARQRPPTMPQKVKNLLYKD